MSKPHPVLDPNNFWLYSLYVILLSLAGAAVLEVLKGLAPHNPLLSMGLTAGTCVLLSFVIWIVFHREFRRLQESKRLVIVGICAKLPRRSHALIALCGPAPAEKRTRTPAYEAAKYHRGELKHLWLITSRGGEETAKWINQEVSTWDVVTHAPVVLDDTSAVELIRVEVENVRKKAIETYGIDENEVICDFTGMTKPVTAGMVLACAPKERRLEYLQGKYDEHGRLLPDAPSELIEIEIQYDIEPQA